MEDLVSANWLAYERGRKMFRHGRARPREPTEAEIEAMSPEFCTWLGWMAARAQAFFERRRVMELLGVDD